MTTTTTENSVEIWLIALASGSSSRIGGVKKEYLPFEDGTVLSSGIKTFLKTLKVTSAIITFPFRSSEEERKLEKKKAEDAVSVLKEEICQCGINFFFVEGGASRCGSVFNALKEIDRLKKSENPVVLIHDGARPFVSSKTIGDVFAAAIEFGAAAPGVQPVDTQKEVDENGIIIRHLPRPRIRAVQTPQAFDFLSIFDAHKHASLSKKEYTDDTEVWGDFFPEKQIKIVEGDKNNIKITFKEDLSLLQ